MASDKFKAIQAKAEKERQEARLDNIETNLLMLVDEIEKLVQAVKALKELMTNAKRK